MYRLLLTYFLTSILLISIIPGYASSNMINPIVSTHPAPIDNHTVLIEYFTSTECINSTEISNSLYETIASKKYNFQYITLLVDKYGYALNRSKELGVDSYPSLYFDGGYATITDVEDISHIVNRIDDCKSRDLPSIDLNLNSYWHQCPCQRGIGISIDVTNGEDNLLDLRLMISVVSFSSDWRDYNGRPFDYLLLGYVDDRTFTLQPSPLGRYNIEYDWNPPFIDDLDTPNLLVIASVLSNSTGYVYKTSISRVIEGEPPDRPATPEGVDNCKMDIGYNYTTYSVDPDSDLIRYAWDWDGDYNIDEFTDYYNSGEKIDTLHKWNQRGNYQIRVKAIDGRGMESYWSQPLNIKVRSSRIFFLYHPSLNINYLSKTSFLYKLEFLPKFRTLI